LDARSGQRIRTTATRPTTGRTILNNKKDTTMTKKEPNIDTQEVGECLWHLSGLLMNANLDDDDSITIISAIDKLATMLARWHYIR
jgi:hypothetical protein